MSLSTKNYLGVGLAGLAIIVFWVFIMPGWDRISLLNEAILEREGILQSRIEILKKIEGLNKQYREKAADVGKISSVVPNSKNSAELVSAIETTTRQTGLQLNEFTMGEANKQQEEMQTMFVELGLMGNYTSLMTFLDLLEKNIRLIDVFELSASQASTPGEQIVLNFRIKANTYYLNVK